MKFFSLKFIISSLSSVGLTVLAVIIGIIVLELILWIIFAKIIKTKWAVPIMLLTPAALGLVMLIVFPIVYELVLSSSNMSLRRFKNPEFGLVIAWQNLKLIFTEPVLKQVYFLQLFLQTLAWTLIQIFFHVVFGMILALLLNYKVKFKGIFRTLLILPWAMPQIVAVLAWRTEFNFEYGFVNIMLRAIGIGNPPQWLTDPVWNFIAMNIVNIWLGVPFMMVILLGGLQSIDKTFYEAAEIDGANAFQKFRRITLPLLKPILTPAIVLGIIWTFNNFNVPYLINQNLLESSDILVTALFRAAFDYNRYGFAAMFSVVIFLILLALTIIYMKISGFSSDNLSRAGVNSKKTKLDLKAV